MLRFRVGVQPSGCQAKTCTPARILNWDDTTGRNLANEPETVFSRRIIDRCHRTDRQREFCRCRRAAREPCESATVLWGRSAAGIRRNQSRPAMGRRRTLRRSTAAHRWTSRTTLLLLHRDATQLSGATVLPHAFTGEQCSDAGSDARRSSHSDTGFDSDADPSSD